MLKRSGGQLFSLQCRGEVEVNECIQLVCVVASKAFVFRAARVSWTATAAVRIFCFRQHTVFTVSGVEQSKGTYDGWSFKNGVALSLGVDSLRRRK
jgi:hypothetical protein